MFNYTVIYTREWDFPRGNINPIINLGVLLNIIFIIIQSMERKQIMQNQQKYINIKFI